MYKNNLVPEFSKTFYNIATLMDDNLIIAFLEDRVTVIRMTKN